MAVLSELSDSLAEIVENVGPAVVRVEARRRVPSSGTVWASDGTIVTADHVIEREEDMRIGLPDGQTVAATLVGRDPTTDVAVLRVQTSLKAPAWGQLDAARVGHLVLALARPGRTVRARLGIINALGDAWRAPTGGGIDRYLETDVAMAFGFSGGPLVDTTGKVLGLNTSGLLQRAALTVPVPTLRKVVETLLTHGRIRRGYLGVGAHPVRLPGELRQQLGQETGLILVSIDPGSPAERGGLLLGDVIVALDGRPARHLANVMERLSADSLGKALSVRIIRGGRVQDLSVVIGER